MNIFVLHKDPEKSAIMHNDKHVVKMILESAQMLCTCHWLNNSSAKYKKAYEKHPCNLWLCKSISNYRWLVKLAMALCSEYTFRYGKIHKSQSVIEYCHDNEPNLPNLPLTEFVQAMPDEYKQKNPIKAYRSYYIGEKLNFSNWKGRNIPSWVRK